MRVLEEFHLNFHRGFMGAFERGFSSASWGTKCAAIILNCTAYLKIELCNALSFSGRDAQQRERCTARCRSNFEAYCLTSMQLPQCSIMFPGLSSTNIRSPHGVLCTLHGTDAQRFWLSLRHRTQECKSRNISACVSRLRTYLYLLCLKPWQRQSRPGLGSSHCNLTFYFAIIFSRVFQHFLLFHLNCPTPLTH